MKRFRLLFVVAGAVVVLLLLALALVFNSTFQTWMVRRAIAGQPDLHVTFASVSAGLKHVELTDVRFVQPGMVLTLPLVEVDAPVLAAAFEEKVQITRLVAKGWTLNLAKPAVALAPSANVASGPPADTVNNRGVPEGSGTSSPAAAITAASEAFRGIFGQLRVPVDLSVDGVQLEGVVILPESRGQVKVALTGGGLATGKEGKFDVVADAALADESVKTVGVRGAIHAAMDSPRTFMRVASQLDVSATGTKFPDGVNLHADVSVAKVDQGEIYSASVIAAGQDVITIKAALPRDAPTFSGTWKLNLRDVHLAPFAFGIPLPVFTAIGEGVFDGDARFEAVHASGRLDTTLDRLDVVLPELAALGELKIVADFDLSEHDGNVGVGRIEAAISGKQPVATVRALQPFEINFGTGELRTATTGGELLGLALHAVPVAWIAPYLKNVDVTGGQVRGELSALAQGGGVTVRSKTPLQVDAVSVAQAGKPLVERLTLALSAAADYTPKGWQAELSELKVVSGETSVVSLDAKIGQLAGADQPLKATGTLAANLPLLLAQPAAAGVIALTNGDAAVEFVLSLGEKKEIQANVSLRRLETRVDNNTVTLPALSTNLRADIAPDGAIAFNAPVGIERSGRNTDLTLIGTIGPERDKMRGIDAVVTSTQLVVEDAQVFAAVLSEKKATDARPADAAPPWAGLHGALALQLKSIIYSESVQVNNVTGRLRIDAGMLKLEGLQAGLGEGGRASVNGRVTFQATAPQPYALQADVALSEFDPAPWFRALTGNHPATVEGKFDITSNVAGRATTFADLAAGAGGDFQLTSKGGVFRGLPVDVSNIVENTSKLAAWLASAGTAISAMAGKKDFAEVANKAEAVAELARGLNPIPYDQLSVSLERDAALNTTLRNFTLISPEVRLSGSGTALHKPGSCLIEDSLAMEFTLRARGRQGELLKYLGALEPQTDDLGYATCTVPLRVSGSLGKPDTSELNTQLTALAIERSGFGDKAAEFLNKIRGGKQSGDK